MTKELVLIGHGKMAEEVKKSAELIMGPQEHIHVVCLLPEEGPEDFEKKFQDTINGIPEEDLTVFSDLMGGTPANTVSRLIMGGQNIHLVAGMNLVMVIDWLNSQTTCVGKTIRGSFFIMKMYKFLRNKLLDISSNIPFSNPNSELT